MTTISQPPANTIPQLSQVSIATSHQLQEIDGPTLKTWLDQGLPADVFLVDVREPGEYASERIPGARSMPLSRFDPEAIVSAVRPIGDSATHSEDRSEPTDRPGVGAESGQGAVILYCQSGNRSRQAGHKLLAAGCDRVVHLQGGLPAWRSAGGVVTRTKGAPISMMRQVQIVAGSLVVTGTLLGAFVAPGFLVLSGFVGAGLVFAGLTNTCGMALLLAKLPYNRDRDSVGPGK